MASVGASGPFRFYLHATRLSFKSRMTSRLNALTQIATVLLKEGTQISLIYIVLQRFPSLGGWSAWEVGLLYSILSVVRRFMTAFVGGSWALARVVFRGELDDYLVSPRGPLFVLNSRASAPWRVLTNLSIIAILAICIRQSGIVLDVRAAASLAAMLISGVAILYSLYLFVGSAALWAVQVSALRDLLSEIQEFASYPLNIYGTVVGAILTVLVPVGFINYYPAAVLLAKVDGVLFSQHLGLLTPLVSALLVASSLLAFRFGLRRYASASVVGGGHSEN